MYTANQNEQNGKTLTTTESKRQSRFRIPELKPQKTESEPKQETKELPRDGAFTGSAKGKQKGKVWLRTGLYLAIAVLILACYLNITPYDKFIQWVGSKALTGSAISFVMMLPIIGWLLGAIGNALTFSLAAFLWATIQLFEVLPMVIFRDPTTLRNLLERSQRHSQHSYSANDSQGERAIKQALNIKPANRVIQLRFWRKFFYTVDFFINTTTYPPVEGGNFGKMLQYLFTMQFGKFDWGNIVMIVISLFVVEFFLLIVLTLMDWLDDMKQARKGEAANG